MQNTPTEALVATELAGYRVAALRRQFAGVEQRWLVVESEARQASDFKHLSQQISKHQNQANAQLRQLSRNRFACPADADAAAREREQSWRSHCLAQVTIVDHPATAQRNRSQSNDAPVNPPGFGGQATVMETATAIAIETRRAGRFMLATHVFDSVELSDEALLGESKAQQSPERGFRFLQAPLCFTASVFLQSPQRGAALAMVMGLC